MADFKFYYPIQVRYGDLDPQWHVNNTRFLAYIEQARLAYMMSLGLFDGKSFHDMGTITADVHIAYLGQIRLGQDIQVGVRVARLGNKSIRYEAQIEDRQSEQVLARCEIVSVGFDYHRQVSLPIPEQWRRVISDFEGIPPGPQQI